MASQGSNVLISLKNKMQSLRDELEKYKEFYEDKCKEVSVESDKVQKVMILKLTTGNL